MTKLLLATAASLAISSSAFACAPAPSCWLKTGPSYVRGICQGYARDHRTVDEITSYMDEPEKTSDFIKACKKLGVTFAVEKYKPMTIDFVGDWCFDNEDKGEANYQLPSWREDGKCSNILSIDKFGFFFKGDDVYCEPVSVKTSSETAPSGTTYDATIAARCRSSGPVAPNGGKLRTFTFSRYKGSLFVKERK